ncbi:MAG: hypothetical protein KY475_00965 [Planctomycetes bacterium]|nr:hypothetical protein [Planctomycetota bacterium]
MLFTQWLQEMKNRRERRRPCRRKCVSPVASAPETLEKRALFATTALLSGGVDVDVPAIEAAPSAGSALEIGGIGANSTPHLGPGGGPRQRRLEIGGIGESGLDPKMPDLGDRSSQPTLLTAHVYNREDVSIRHVRLKAVYLVPKDRTPSAGWQDDLTNILPRLKNFHEREFRTARGGEFSKMSLELHGPVTGAKSTDGYRDLGDDFYGKMVREVRELDRAGGLTHPVYESASVEDQAGPPSVTVYLIFADWGLEDVAPASHYQKCLWDEAAHDYVCHGEPPSARDWLDERGYFVGGNAPAGYDLSDISQAGGSQARFWGIDDELGAYGAGIVTEEGWKHPEIEGTAVVAYHEGPGHSLGMPHPEPEAANARNPGVMGLALYNSTLEDAYIEPSILREMAPPSLIAPWIEASEFLRTNTARETRYHGIRLTFTEAIDASTVDPDDFEIRVQSMLPPAEPFTAAVTSIVADEDQANYEIRFPTMTFDDNAWYRIDVRVGPDIQDLQGDLLDPNQDRVPGDSYRMFAVNHPFAAQSPADLDLSVLVPRDELNSRRGDRTRIPTGPDLRQLRTGAFVVNQRLLESAAFQRSFVAAGSGLALEQPASVNTTTNAAALSDGRISVSGAELLVANSSFRGAENAVQLDDGTLTITGSDLDDVVVVDETSDGALVVTVSTYDGAGSLVREEQTVTNREEATDLVFEGLAGDDWFLNSTSMPARADGGSGSDYLSGGSAHDRLFGARGDDVLRGGSGRDRLYGGNGHDRMFGGSGRDRLYGARGNDLLYGGRHNDVLKGGAGNDILKGGRNNDRLYGGAGNDRLYGQHGHDRLYGQSGHDRLDGGRHNDRLYGGRHNDVLKGGRNNDRLYGGAGNDRLYGQHGHDRLYGQSGHDRLDGGRHNDRLYGADGRDRLYGRSGNDRLDGGYDGDRDYLHGGSGTDRFIQHLQRRVRRWFWSWRSYWSAEDAIADARDRVYNRRH